MMVAFLSLSCVGVKIIDFVLTKGVHDRLPIFIAVNIYSCHLGFFQSEPHPDLRLIFVDCRLQTADYRLQTTIAF